jgi:hypothetical protein
MINKGKLQSIISKYYLNGLNESVKWDTEDNQLQIDFQSPNRDMIGRVISRNFPLENSEIAVYDTSKLTKLLGITNGDVFLSLEQQKAVFTKLIIADATYTLNFSLTDLLLIQTLGAVTDPENYEISWDMDKENIDAVIKAHNALSTDNVIFKLDKDLDLQDVLVMVFGDNSNHTNKIEYQLQGASFDNLPYGAELPFNSEMIRVIMNNNKDADSANMSINTQGLMKLSFSGEDWESVYYLIRKADI